MDWEGFSTHVCEYCFNVCNIFCGCKGEQEAIKKEREELGKACVVFYPCKKTNGKGKLNHELFPDT